MRNASKQALPEAAVHLKGKGTPSEAIRHHVLVCRTDCPQLIVSGVKYRAAVFPKAAALFVECGFAAASSPGQRSVDCIGGKELL